MIFAIKLAIVIVLTILYIAYIIELHRHLTYPFIEEESEGRQKKLLRYTVILLGVFATIATALIIRKHMLPQPLFSLIVASLQMIFVIPVFFTILTDRLLFVWKKKRLPYAVTLITILSIIGVIIASNGLILFGSDELIDKASNTLLVISDILAGTILITLGLLGVVYWISKKK